MYTADDSSQEKIGATKQPARHWWMIICDDKKEGSCNSNYYGVLQQWKIYEW